MQQEPGNEGIAAASLDKKGGSYTSHTIEGRWRDGRYAYNVYGWMEPPCQETLQSQDVTKNIVHSFSSLKDAVIVYPDAQIISGRLRQLVLRAAWPDEWPELERWIRTSQL